MEIYRILIRGSLAVFVRLFTDTIRIELIFYLTSFSLGGFGRSRWPNRVFQRLVRQYSFGITEKIDFSSSKKEEENTYKEGNK
jgi:hypothetical protein